MNRYDYDAIVIGSGPNGLTAAVSLQQAGLSVLLVEAKDTVGGGLRSAELTQPHFLHDICSAVHPLAALSPFLRTLPLEKFGLEFINPPVAAAHPFDDGTAAALFQSMDDTCQTLSDDAKVYRKLMEPLTNDWPSLMVDVLGPLRFPKGPITALNFGIRALRSASGLASRFRTKEARGLWAGMAAHSMQPFSNATTSAIGLILLLAGHTVGWPIAKGGSGSIANALASCFISLGGNIQTGMTVSFMKQLPSSKVVLFDLSPKQMLEIAGDRFSPGYKHRLQKFRYGMGVFKLDWALDGPIPFIAETCWQAGTIHLGNSFDEIANAEQMTSKGKHPDKPFVLLAQQSLFDSSRAPEGKHTAWAYCHVPNGSTVDMTNAIEMQVERFAPGFRDRIIARHSMNSVSTENYNPNYVGGDIAGGAMNFGQLFARPVLQWSPYRTSAKDIYICSASTPPGGGAHGMCGYHAARRALKDIFGIHKEQ